MREGNPIGLPSQFPSLTSAFASNIIMDWETDVQCYLTIFSEGCPEELRPMLCKNCMTECLLHRHGKYKRKVHVWELVILIFIYRFKCPVCGHTLSLLPSFVGPHQQVTWDVQEKVIRENDAGTSLDEIASNWQPSYGAFSVKSLWRWKRQWDERLAILETPFWTWLIQHVPHLHIPVGVDKPVSKRAWLSEAWAQARTRIQSADFGLFHWLYRLSKSLTMADNEFNPT